MIIIILSSSTYKTTTIIIATNYYHVVLLSSSCYYRYYYEDLDDLRRNMTLRRPCLQRWAGSDAKSIMGPLNDQVLPCLRPGPCESMLNVSCGVRTHAQLPAVDLKSTPLTTRANWLLRNKEAADIPPEPEVRNRFDGNEAFACNCLRHLWPVSRNGLMNWFLGGGTYTTFSNIMRAAMQAVITIHSVKRYPRAAAAVNIQKKFLKQCTLHLKNFVWVLHQPSLPKTLNFHAGVLFTKSDTN